MADPLPVEVDKVRKTRYFLTGMLVATVVLAGMGAVFRVVEQREDCVEQRAARVVNDEGTVTLVHDFADALVEVGNNDRAELEPIVDDIIRRQRDRWADRPPPSACT